MSTSPFLPVFYLPTLLALGSKVPSLLSQHLEPLLTYPQDSLLVIKPFLQARPDEIQLPHHQIFGNLLSCQICAGEACNPIGVGRRIILTRILHRRREGVIGVEADGIAGSAQKHSVRACTDPWVGGANGSDPWVGGANGSDPWVGGVNGSDPWVGGLLASRGWLGSLGGVGCPFYSPCVLKMGYFGNSSELYLL